MFFYEIYKEMGLEVASHFIMRLSISNHLIVSRVADPGEVDPDQTFKKKLEPDPAVKKKTDPDPTLEKKRIKIRSNFDQIMFFFFRCKI